MLTVKIEGLDKVRKSLDDLAKRQVPYAASRALNITAQRVRTDSIVTMGRVFDRPTEWTLNSLFVKPATKQKLEAVVWLKDYAAKGTPASKYLAPQIFGGPRGMKRFERALQHAGILPPGWFVTPGGGARLDAHGNVSRGQYVQALSALRASPDPWQNRTGSARSRRNARKAQYFVGGRQGTKGAHLAPGIYQRFGSTGGAPIKPVFAFVRAPQYQARFKFFDVARRTIERDLIRSFNEELAHALATARR